MPVTAFSERMTETWKTANHWEREQRAKERD